MRKSIRPIYRNRSQQPQGQYNYGKGLQKAALSSLTYIGGSMLIFPRDIGKSVRIMGYDLPLYILLGVAGASSSYGGDLISQMAFNRMQPSKFKDISQSVSDALISGAIGTAVMFGGANIPMENLFKVMVYSTGQNLANEYLYSNVLGM